ncbi:hypothetical protein N431DRAFT_327052 [Stipitochalara longipes BDJ]|nr:hypothetical protein N431DRAFT_327052 [Stipitochalara longipes BDJ]
MDVDVNLNSAVLVHLIRQLEHITKELATERQARYLAETRISNLQKELAESKDQIKGLEEKYIPLKADYQALQEDKIALIKELDEMTELCASKKKLLYLQKPLVEIGVAVRKRFLQKGAQNAHTWVSSAANGGYPASSLILDDGNKAAHNGNIETDMALFKCGYLTAKQGASRFETIYHHRHDLQRFPWGYPTTIEKWNLMATLRSSCELRRVYSPEDKFRVVSSLDEIMDLFEEIQIVGRKDFDLARYTQSCEELYDRGATKFAENAEVKQRVDKLRELVENVVKKVWRKASVPLQV